MGPRKQSLANKFEVSGYLTEFHKDENLWIWEAFCDQETLKKCKVGKRTGIG